MHAPYVVLPALSNRYFGLNFLSITLFRQIFKKFYLLEGFDRHLRQMFVGMIIQIYLYQELLPYLCQQILFSHHYRLTLQLFIYLNVVHYK